jgi:hypothetical protein
MIYQLEDKKVIDLSAIEAITEAKSIWGMPGHNGHTNSAGTYFGFDIYLKLNPTPVSIFLCFDTEANIKTVNIWRDNLIFEWKKFKGLL